MPTTQMKRHTLSPCIGSETNVKKDSSAQDASASGEGHYPGEDTSTGYECSICLDPISPQEMKSLPCVHIFHEACIDTWLDEESSSCPLCRQDPSVNDIPSRNQVQINREELEVLPWTMIKTFCLLFSLTFISVCLYTMVRNCSISMRINNGGFMWFNNRGIDMMHNYGGFLRIDNHGIDMRLGNGNFIKMNDRGIEIWFYNSPFVTVNNDGIRIHNYNILNF
ncbi:unnamed protein product [Larinioides sclopetarius]|uniref:RING-type domain-containing protein n=1 Tax=Larinioides sclopetarius TaxID=280406 RepID=A0AAV2AB03_9ARAC